MSEDQGGSFSFQVILVELHPSGFQRSFFDDEDLNTIAEGDNVYAFQVPPSPGQGTLSGITVLGVSFELWIAGLRGCSKAAEACYFDFQHWEHRVCFPYNFMYTWLIRRVTQLIPRP